MRTKENKINVNQNLLHKWLIDRFRKRRDSAVDNEKQLSLALQEIEQVKYDELIQITFFFIVTNRITSSRRTCSASIL
jgi:pantothenate kinase